VLGERPSALEVLAVHVGVEAVPRGVCGLEQRGSPARRARRPPGRRSPPARCGRRAGRNRRPSVRRRSRGRSPRR
jgi:hypothetical protein